MTVNARLSIAVDQHLVGLGVRGMSAPRAMAFFTLNAFKGPGTNQARPAILITLRAIAGGVAGAAIIIQLCLACVESHPPVAKFELLIEEIVLSCGILILTGNDEAILVDEPRFPVVAADDVANIIPSSQV
jgi:hypothetical protein